MTDSAPRPAPSSDPALSELQEAYDSGKLVVFAGAGVSAAAGLPGWKRLVEVLSDRARLVGGAAAALQEIAELTAARQFIDALSALKDCLGASDFCTVIERHLDDRLIDEPDVARAIDEAECAAGEPQGRPRVKLVRLADMLDAANAAKTG